MLELLDQGDAAVETVKKIIAKLDDACPKFALAEVRTLAPIPRPRKTFSASEKNYVEHALEFEKTKDASVAVPKVPVVFSKPPTCVIGTGAIVKNHSHMTSQLDYEVELAVVIGKKSFRVPKKKRMNMFSAIPS